MNSQNLLRHGAKEKIENLKNKKNSLVKSVYSLKANRKSYFLFIFIFFADLHMYKVLNVHHDIFKKYLSFELLHV